MQNSEETIKYAKSTILLTVLPYDLKIVTIDKERARTELIPTFMKLFFYSNTADRFLNYTETSHEISLVAEEKALEIFAPNCFDNSCVDTWSALQIYEGGSSPCDQVTFIQRISTALARGSVSVFLISTYQTDCVLIKQDDVERAVECLRKHFVVEVEGIEQQVHDDIVIQNEELQAIEDFPVHNHMLSVSPLDLYLFQLSKTCVRSHVWGLVRLFFCSDASTDFVSWTEMAEEISVMTSDPSFLEYAHNNDDLEVSPDIWRVIQIGSEHLGFNETGIVASQSAVISKSSSAIFYLSTFATDFVMVKKDEWSEVYKTLKLHFIVQEGGFAALHQAPYASKKQAIFSPEFPEMEPQTS